MQLRMTSKDQYLHLTALVTRVAKHLNVENKKEKVFFKFLLVAQQQMKPLD